MGGGGTATVGRVVVVVVVKSTTTVDDATNLPGFKMDKRGGRVVVVVFVCIIFAGCG